MKRYFLLTALALTLASGLIGCAPVTAQTPDIGAGNPGGNAAPGAAGTAGVGFPTGGGH